VEFNQPLNANTFIDNGCKVKFAGSGAIGWTLADDETYEGDLYLGGGVLDLNGHELKVTGNLIQSGGTIDINGGKLYIEGTTGCRRRIRELSRILCLIKVT